MSEYAEIDACDFCHLPEHRHPVDGCPGFEPEVVPGERAVTEYAVGDRVSVVLNFNPRRVATGVVTRLPVGESPWYVVDLDGEPEGQGMHFPVDEILGEMPPENPTPAELLSWLRA